MKIMNECGELDWNIMNIFAQDEGKSEQSQTGGHIERRNSQTEQIIRLMASARGRGSRSCYYSHEVQFER